MASSDHGERLLTLEINMQHMDKAMTELIKLNTGMNETLTKLTEQVLLTRSLSEQVMLLGTAREDHEKQLTLHSHQLKELETLPDEVRRNSIISKIVTAIGAASLSGVVAVVFSNGG